MMRFENPGRARTAFPVRFLWLLVSAAACTGADASPPGTGGWRGAVLDEPVPRPDFTLTDTEGQPFDFRARTDGALTLVFFGYTSCPDICPVHMANLGAVLERQSWETRSRTRVVFVTTDPERDTPDVIRTWLDRFDPSFVGLRGPIEEVNRIQRAMRMPESVAGVVRPDGSYDVGHAASVLAFSPDGAAHVAYLFGTRQADWEHDLPRLLRGDTP
jgi:protein SCO1/2